MYIIAYIITFPYIYNTEIRSKATLSPVRVSVVGTARPYTSVPPKQSDGKLRSATFPPRAPAEPFATELQVYL